MAAKDSPKFCFLPAITSDTRTRRDVELSSSSARSHIAKILHRRHRLKVTLSTARSSSTTHIQGTGASVQIRASISNHVSLPFPYSHQHEQPTSLKSNISAHREIIQEKANCSEADLRFDEWVVDDAVDLDIQQMSDVCKTQFQNDSSLSAGKCSVTPSLSLYRPNPWTTVSHHLSTLHSLRLFEFYGTRLWQGYNPGMGVDDPFAPLYAAAWAASEADNSALFSTQMWQAAIHLSVQSSTPITEPESFKYYQRALQLVFEDLQKPVRDVGHKTICAILGLCIPEPQAFENHNSLNGGFRSPLLELQWIGLLGREPLVETHLKALFKIIDFKGGIDMLQIFPTTYAVQYLDVLDATLRLVEPRYPLAEMFQTANVDRSRENCFGLTELLRNIHQGPDFEEAETSAIKELMKHRLSPQMREIMLDMRMWARLLPRLSEQTNVQVGGSFIALRRNIIQHKLLHTINICGGPVWERAGKQDDFSGYQDASTVTKVVGIGLLIFSAGVTFPVQYAPLYSSLVGQLQNLLKRNLPTLLDRELYCLLIWLGMLGCLATMRAPVHDTKEVFVQIMCQAERMRVGASSPPSVNPKKEAFGIQGERIATFLSWEEVKAICLTPYIWNNDACDFAAQHIWCQVRSQLGQ